MTKFIGRRAELDRLLAAAGDTDAAIGPKAVEVLAVTGVPGVGKTALVAHAAALLTDRYPDGQYLVRLHAHTLNHNPADPAAVLAHLLVEGLGLHNAHLPDTPGARAALWRDRLVGRRVLLVLDDAADAEQVAPLLPGPGADNCLVLVTSRHHLSELDVSDTIELDVLPEDDAVLLFTALARHPPTVDRRAVKKIVHLGGHLPLAITLLAGRIATRTEWNPADCAEEFAKIKDRHAEPAHGDPAIAAAFEMSYRGLPPSLRRMFRRLSLHPGPDIDAHAAAALADVPLTRARRELAALHAAHLVTGFTGTTADRYRFHNLLGAYAHTLATHRDPRETREQALTRLLNHYQHTAEAAAQFFDVIPRPRQPSQPRVTGPALPDRDAALAWLRAEQPNLIACLDHAARHDRPTHVIRTTAALAAFRRLYGPWPEAARLHQQAADIAHRIGDRLGPAGALSDLGRVRSEARDHQTAAELLERALELYTDLGDPLAQADALRELGLARGMCGDSPSAAGLLKHALDLYLDLGDLSGQITIRLDLELDCAQLATGGQAAVDLLERALDLTDSDESFARALLLHELGRVRLTGGEYPAAADLFEQSLHLLRECGELWSEAEVLNSIGTLFTESSRPAEAVTTFREALELARAVGSGAQEARALEGKARTLAGMGDRVAALADMRTAVSIYQRIDAVEAASASAFLAELEGGGDRSTRDRAAGA
ncbi:tetratricopeptide repeat protein [Embleya sp. NPDC001921]